MFVWVGNRIINTDQVVAVSIHEPGELKAHRFDLDKGDVANEERVVKIDTTAIAGREYGGEALRIELEGDQAEEFLGALTLYGPLGPESWAGGSS